MKTALENIIENFSSVAEYVALMNLIIANTRGLTINFLLKFTKHELQEYVDRLETR